MFISYDAFEVPYPAPLLPQGGRYFRAIELPLRLAWYLVTFRVTEDSVGMLHTHCFAWDLQFLDWLRNNRGFELKSIQQVRPREGDAGWEMHDILRVWETPYPDMFVQAKRLIFEDAQAALFEGRVGQNQPKLPDDRRLVIDLST